MELFFDTETTGLPLFKEPATHPGQPDVIQLAAVLSTEDEIVDTLKYLINPSDINPGWKMNPFAEAAHCINDIFYPIFFCIFSNFINWINY